MNRDRQSVQDADDKIAACTDQLRVLNDRGGAIITGIKRGLDDLGVGSNVVAGFERAVENRKGVVTSQMGEENSKKCKTMAALKKKLPNLNRMGDDVVAQEARLGGVVSQWEGKLDAMKSSVDRI